jgi:hypothetical protein
MISMLHVILNYFKMILQKASKFQFKLLVKLGGGVLLIDAQEIKFWDNFIYLKLFTINRILDK